MYCPNCGNMIPNDSKYCSHCGEKTFRTRKKSKVWIIPVIIIALLICGFAGYYIYQQFNKLISPDYNKLSESVVMIECYDENGNDYATGSGVIILSNDIVVTNYHVVADDAYSFYVVADDGQKKKAVSVVAYSEEKDLVLLKLDSPTNIQPLPIGESKNLHRGEKVTAIGSPLGLLNTVSEGIVGGFFNDGEITAIQITTPISQGSSGGALLNEKGELIGITYAGIDAGQNLNFAIPAYEIDYVLTSGRIDLDTETFYNLRDHQTGKEDSEPFEDDGIYSVEELFAEHDSLDNQEIVLSGYISSINTEGEVLLVQFIEDAAGKWIDSHSSNNHDERREELEKIKNGKCVSVHVLPEHDWDRYYDKYSPFTNNFAPYDLVLIRGKLVHNYGDSWVAQTQREEYGDFDVICDWNEISKVAE